MPKNTSRKGNEGERFVIKWLEERGWLVATRRHLKGPGDILATLPHSGTVWLIESKYVKPKQLWQNFERKDRQEMREQPLPEGGERLVCNVLSIKNEELMFVGEKSWP